MIYRYNCPRSTRLLVVGVGVEVGPVVGMVHGAETRDSRKVVSDFVNTLLWVVRS